MFSLNEQKAIELGESGERAIREQNEYDALQYAEYLRELGHELLESNFEKESKRVVISLRNIGNKAIQKKMDNVASTAINELKYLSETALDKNFSNAMWSFSKAAQEIGKGAVQAEMLEPAKLAIDTLKMIGMGAVEKKMEVVTLWTTMSLEEMAYLANKQQLEDLTKEAKEAREEIIEYSEASGFVTKEQIDKYPQLIAQTVSQFSELRNLQPAGYETKPNEEFTEEEFFEGEGEEQDPETEAARKEK
ncbi:hypothetical protein MSBRW_1104 [Methanosarcina barkeri str. Wiesmoor]|uniref:Uncharacterized protein n=2 Tax=Methanosarcina barkeri TaxID=2208 RepID=A0A0E3QJV8_METBA|nr:hypothetical protein [Methanosarcina barkeri]AKB50357.1 hypothetical protein MSBRW_1104 [Methanosarcina barkeri str. Wiesmoor]